MRPLVVPPAAQRDEQAVQMLSAWIADKGLHCTINIGFWQAQGRQEPAAWGILIADVVRHIANALRDQQGAAVDSTMEQLLESLHRELDDPTSATSGGFHPGHS
jgi:Domain of unknown function (DUF5076)